MTNEIITLGENLEPPSVSMEKTQDIYNCVRTDEFNVETFNALLLAVVTYLNAHDAEYATKNLPWTEVVKTA